VTKEWTELTKDRSGHIPTYWSSKGSGFLCIGYDDINGSAVLAMCEPQEL